MRNIVIIGGGAAGLMAAVSAGKEGIKVTVVEKNNRPARKVMITGKGRCNVTNNCDADTLISNVAHGGKFLYSAFSLFNSSDTMSFFERVGVPLKTERGNRVFPVSDKAVDIVDALVAEAKKCAVLKTGTAEEILVKNGTACGVRLASGEVLTADAVIIATGGKSYPLTGSTGDGYALAGSLGHTVTDITPSLIRIDMKEGFFPRVAGLSLKNVTLSLYKNGAKKPVFKQLGELLFTHTGISGPLTLSASAFVDGDPKEYFAEIDLKPALDEKTLDNRLLRDFSDMKNRELSNALDKLLPKSIIPIIISKSGVSPDIKVNQISRNDRAQLINVIKHLTLCVSALGPIEEAVVTRGGITLKEINPSDMSSKIVKNLYFAGEVMDVDAYTGGFNLQIAFSTGFLAGKSAANR